VIEKIETRLESTAERHASGGWPSAGERLSEWAEMSSRPLAFALAT
jgi:hypothetical protein